jgi:LmbE family N-acetylglucosaminyl deacetylase
VHPTIEAREAIARRIRALRPAILIAPWRRDLHPDHAAVGVLARQAYFIAGLRSLDRRLPPHRPARVFYYPSHDLFRADFVVVLDEALHEQKVRAVRCYRSQIEPGNRGDRGEHFVHRLDILDRMTIRARFYGGLARVPYAEPFRIEGVLTDANPLDL